MTYVGNRNEDGSISATRLEFVRNELEKGEANIWKRLSAKVKASNFAQGKAGQLQIKGIGKFRLVPNADAQNYIANLGTSLIPAVQKNIPGIDKEKIPFQFYLIQDKEPNAFATANGIIVVHDSMLEILENESQLAFIMAHEISHSIQEHTWRQMQYHRKKLAALAIGGAIAGAFGGWGSVVQNVTTLTEAAVKNGYARDLENQADRMALEYMTSAGFDPREAPRVWKVMSSKFGNQSTNVFWSNHDSHATRRSYLMVELRNNYNNVDYSTMSKDRAKYSQISELVKTGRANKYKVKVKY
jgi:predicted Zn-dependent protease